MASWTAISVAIDSTEQTRVHKPDNPPFVHVYLHEDALVVLSDATVAEELARAFWDAADHLRAKNDGEDPDTAVMRTLAAMDHVLNGGKA